MKVKNLAQNQSIFRWLYYLPSRCMGKLARLYMNKRYPGLDFEMDFDTEFDKQTGFGYEGVAEPFLLELIRRVPFKKSEIHFLDVGCGKGNTLLLARKYQLAKVAGVELSDKFFAACESNMRILGLDDVILFHRNAAQLDSELDSYNVIYLFNSFPGDVLREFLSHLKESVTRQPRRISVIYVNPVFAGVFDEMGFRETQRFEMETYYLLYKSIFYEH